MSRIPKVARTRAKKNKKKKRFTYNIDFNGLEDRTLHTFNERVEVRQEKLELVQDLVQSIFEDREEPEEVPDQPATSLWDIDELMERIGRSQSPSDPNCKSIW